MKDVAFRPCLGDAFTMEVKVEPDMRGPLPCPPELEALLRKQPLNPFVRLELEPITNRKDQDAADD